MSDLAEFLLARIAEDEEVAKAATQVPWGIRASAVRTSTGYKVAPGVQKPANRLHIARHDPGRVLAECDTKRRIVEESALWGCSKTMAQILALPYADHADYDESWRP